MSKIDSHKIHGNLIRVDFRARNDALLSERNKRGLTQKEIANYIGINQTEYSKAERMEPLSRPSVKKICHYFEKEVDELFPQWAQDYSKMVNNRNRYILIDNEYAQKALEGGVEEKLLQESFDTDIQSALSSLTKRESLIVQHFFGIGGVEQKTLSELGQMHDLSSERIRHIKEIALRKLRHQKHSKILKDYL